MIRHVFVSTLSYLENYNGKSITLIFFQTQTVNELRLKIKLKDDILFTMNEEAAIKCHNHQDSGTELNSEWAITVLCNQYSPVVQFLSLARTRLRN